MFCPSCGKEIVDGATFCTHCGKQIQSSSATVTSESKKGKKFRPILLLIPAVIVIGIILFISLGSSDSINTENLYVGGQVYFGRYEQDNNLKNGKEKILWDVIEEDEVSYRLMSHFILFNDRYDTTHGGKHEFIDSSICQVLNNDFYNTAFTEKEQEQIVPTYPTAEFSLTNVQLLAMEDILGSYDYTSELDPDTWANLIHCSYLICGATDYAIATGFQVEEPTKYYNDGYVMPKEYEGRTGKWLLNYSYVDSLFDDIATVVEADGTANTLTTSMDSKCGIRPIIWIKK